MKVTTDTTIRSMKLVVDELVDAVERINPSELAALADLVRSVDRVFVCGAGRSGLVLRTAAMRLMHLGLSVFVVGETTTPAITGRDALVVASGSGTTSGVVRAAETAQATGATIGVFTANPTSPLAKLASCTVVVPAAQKTDHGMTVSRQYAGSLFEQSVFVATEALFAALWQGDHQPAEQLWQRHANLE